MPLKAGVAELLAKAAAVDIPDIPDGMSIPNALALCCKRRHKLAEARAKLEARTKERFEHEPAEHVQKMAARAAKTSETGKKPVGKPPAPPLEGVLPSDQINLTDVESRAIPVAGGGFGHCCNA